jgi:hypothetical protein
MARGKNAGAVLGELELNALLAAVRGLADSQKMVSMLRKQLKVEMAGGDLDFDQACGKVLALARAEERVVKALPGLVRELRQAMAAIDEAGGNLSAEEIAAALMEAARGLPREIRWRLASELSGQDRPGS